MKLLHVDASILGANSASRQLSAAVVEQLRKATPGLSVTYRDLATQPLAHLTGEQFAAMMGAVPESAAAQQDVAHNTTVLEEFLAADTVVIGAPMYNFTLPSQLKAWIDRIVVKGKTFQYGETGPQGLAGGKRIVILVSRGGIYGADAPASVLEHVESYLRGIFGFIGATPEIIVAEGLARGPESREAAIRDALDAAAKLAA